MPSGNEPGTGNPNWRKGGPSPNPYGRTTSQRVAARNLAVTIREMHGPDESAWWLRCVMAGVDPDARDASGVPVWKRCADAGELVRVEVGSESILKVPDWVHRVAAKKLLDERGYGQPAQHVTLEGEVRAHMTHALAAGDPEMVRLTRSQLEALSALDAASLEVAGELAAGSEGACPNCGSAGDHEPACVAAAEGAP